MGMFDDLIPAQSAPSSGGGMFDDLIPKDKDLTFAQKITPSTEGMEERGMEALQAINPVAAARDTGKAIQSAWSEKPAVSLTNANPTNTEEYLRALHTNPSNVGKFLGTAGALATPAVNFFGHLYNSIAPGFTDPAEKKKVEQEGAEFGNRAMMALGAPRGSLIGAAPTRAAPPPVPETIGDFGTPLTEGEAARDASRIAAEQRALRQGEGPQAQAVAEGRQQARAEHLAGVREDIGRTFDPFGATIAEDPYEAGQIAQQGVQSAAQSARDLYNQRYTEMRSLPGEFHAGAFEGIGQRIRGQLTLGDNPVIVDDRLTPNASNMLRDVDEQIGSLRIQNRADPFGPPNPENITGVNLQGVDQARKRLVSMYKNARTYPPTADTRASKAVLDAFDDQVENALTQGLFTGDDRAIDALREARNAYSSYKQTFGPRGTGDDVGRAMQRILGGPNREPANPTEMANYLYGTANVGASGLSQRLAVRLRDVLGESSPEWSAVKQGLWRRLTERPEGVTEWGPQQVSQRIAKFLNGDGQGLANRVFSPVERGLIQRYGDLMRRMVPPPGTVNYSNNLQWASHFRDHTVRYLTTFIGEKLGGLIGGVAGYGLGLATQPAMNAIRARKIANAMPTVAESMARWDRAVQAANRKGLPGTPLVAATTSNLINNLRNLGIPDTALNSLRSLAGAPGAVPSSASDKNRKANRP